jgi:predicted aldo/keto reductase-like oxidoreductase
VNRRKFLGNTAKQIALLNIAGLTTARAFATTGDQAALPSDKKMIYRTLGRTGIKLPIVSMGVMNANNPALLKAAWDKGIRHFDTAWLYQNGNNEKMVGSVLKELKVDRQDVTVSTKIGLFGPPVSNGRERKALFLKRFDESLGRLQMSYVDILYFHDTQKVENITDPYIVEAFSELKDKKKTRFCGFSTHIDWVPVVQDAVKRKFYDVILLSFNYSMFQDQRVFDTIKLAHDAGIGLVAMKTQCQQQWYKNELSAELQKFYKENMMNTALLKWALKNEYITTAIPGFTTFNQLDEDMAVAYDIEFNSDEEKFLKDNGVMLAIQSVCRHCGQCVETCPKKADIPSLMRTHMYSLSYGNPLMAHQTLKQISPGRGLDLCNGCDICSSKCANRVPIASRISDLKEIYC